jgi:hypothetical protein
MKSTRYKLVTAADQTIWVSLQPLIDDLKDEMKRNCDNPEQLTALTFVKSFLDSLVLEARRDNQ